MIAKKYSTSSEIPRSNPLSAFGDISSFGIWKSGLFYIKGGKPFRDCDSKIFTCHITGEINPFSEDKLLRKHLVQYTCLNFTQKLCRILNYKLSR